MKLLKYYEEQGIITLGRGMIISKEEMRDNSGIFPVYSSSASGDGIFGCYGKYLFDDERITWSIDGGGKLFYRKPHKYSVTNVCGWLKVNDTSKFLTKYIYYSLIHQWKFLEFNYVNKAHPSVIREIYKIKELSIEEQEEIVRKLDAVTEIIQKELVIIPKYNELIKSRFIELFGDPVYNSYNLPELTLPELGDFGRGVSKHRPRNDPKLLGGTYPLIQTGEVANCDLYIEDYTSTYSEFGLKQSKLWNKGTLCITIAANIAKTGILTFDACFPDSIVGFTANEKSNNLFIHYWFTFLQAILEEQAPAAAQKNINLKILSELKVIVPPIELQNEFAEFVRQIDKLEFI